MRSNNSFGERLRTLQEQMGIPTQRTLAGVIGISESHLSRLLSGERKPSWDLHLAIAELEEQTQK